MTPEGPRAQRSSTSPAKWTVPVEVDKPTKPKINPFTPILGLTCSASERRKNTNHGSSLKIVELAREHGRVTIGDAIRLMGVSRNTTKQHFRNLVAVGHLSQHGSGRGVWYALTCG